MESATSKTSFMLCEMRTTAEALVGQALDQVEHLRVWATPSAAVGSSRMTTLEFHSTALAMATVWRWPPDRLATVLAHRADRASPRALASVSFARVAPSWARRAQRRRS